MRVLARPNDELNSPDSLTYKRYGAIFRAFRIESSFISKHHNLRFYARRLIFISSLLYLESGRAQLIIAIGTTSYEILLLSIKRPFKLKEDTCLSIFNEVVLLAVYCLFFAIHESTSDASILGWVAILLIAAANLTNFIFILIAHLIYCCRGMRLRREAKRAQTVATEKERGFD